MKIVKRHYRINIFIYIVSKTFTLLFNTNSFCNYELYTHKWNPHETDISKLRDACTLLLIRAHIIRNIGVEIQKFFDGCINSHVILGICSTWTKYQILHGTWSWSCIHCFWHFEVHNAKIEHNKTGKQKFFCFRKLLLHKTCET